MSTTESQPSSKPETSVDSSLIWDILSVLIVSALLMLVSDFLFSFF